MGDWERGWDCRGGGESRVMLFDILYGIKRSI